MLPLLVVPICARRFHRQYSGQPALLDQHRRGTNNNHVPGTYVHTVVPLKHGATPHNATTGFSISGDFTRTSGKPALLNRHYRGLILVCLEYIHTPSEHTYSKRVLPNCCDTNPRNKLYQRGTGEVRESTSQRKAMPPSPASAPARPKPK